MNKGALCFHFALGLANYVAGFGSTLPRMACGAGLISRVSSRESMPPPQGQQQRSRGPGVLRPPHPCNFTKSPHLPRNPHGILTRGREKDRAQGDSEFSKSLWKPATRGSSTLNRLNIQPERRVFNVERWIYC